MTDDTKRQTRVLTPDEAAYAKRLAGEDLYFALKRTWEVIDAAGLLNLTRGVQLGQTSWYVKATDARALAMQAMTKAEGAA